MAQITKIDTRCMDREDWLAARRSGGIGGSEAGIVLGLSKYRSRYSLFLEKTGQVIPEDISDREAVRLGNDLEEYVARRWEEKTGKKVRRCNAILQNSDYPFAFANPDRLVVGERAGLECKTTSNYEVLDQCKKGFPECYYAQCVHYMMVTGYERWHLAVLVFGRGFYEFTLERDEDEIKALACAEREFWEMVQTNNPPELDGSESTTTAVKDMYPEDDGSEIDLRPVRYNLMVISELDKQISCMEQEKERHVNEVKAYMGEAAKGTVDGFTVTWKNRSSSRFDKKRYEADHPGALEGYMTPSVTRTFSWRLKE